MQTDSPFPSYLVPVIEEDPDDDFVLIKAGPNAICGQATNSEKEPNVYASIRKVTAALLTNSVLQNLKADEAASIKITSIPANKSGEKQYPVEEAEFVFSGDKDNFFKTIRAFITTLVTKQIFRRLNFDLISISVTAFSAIKYTCRPKSLTQVIPDTTSIPQEYLSSIDKIVRQPWTRLQHGEVANFLKYLESTYPNRFDATAAGYGYSPLDVDARKPLDLVQNKLLQYEKRPQYFSKKDLLFIPFGYPGHIVCIAIDFVKKTVEYYDSQGYLSDSWRRQVYPGFNMRQQLEAIKKLCFANDPDAKLLENDVRHQWDSNNCIVYVCDFLERRAKNEDFVTISKSGKSATEIEIVREMLALKLASLPSALI